VNCAAVRDRLPEHALGIADHHDVHSIERHLGWCAACRKEARDLERAAAMMAFAPAPAVLPQQLQERIIAAVRRERPVTEPSRPGRRRGRRIGVVLIAAALMIAGLGAGAVIARRDGAPVDPSTQAQQQSDAFERFQRFIQSAATVDPRTKASVGLLASSGAMPWRGAGLAIVSPSGDDQVVVTVDGLPRLRGPYRVEITDRHGHAVPVAVVRHLDKEGGAMVGRAVARDLTGYVRVIVRDARGRTVLTGVLDPAPPAG